MEGDGFNLERTGVTGRVIIRSDPMVQQTGDTSDDQSGFLAEQTIKHENRHIPASRVERIKERVLPPYVKIANEATESIQECVSKFISYVTTEANRRCHRDNRKTVNGEDLVVAIGNLGFDNYVEPLTLYLNKYRAKELKQNYAPYYGQRKRNVSFVQPRRSPIRPTAPPTNHLPDAREGPSNNTC